MSIEPIKWLGDKLRLLDQTKVPGEEIYIELSDHQGIASATVSTMRQLGMTLSMAIVMLLFTIYIGRVQITPEYYDSFLISAKTAFIVFASLCLIGVLASLAVPQYQRTIARAYKSEAYTQLATLRGSLLRYYAENGTFSGASFSALDVDDPSTNNDRAFDYSVAPSASDFTLTATGRSSTPAGKNLPAYLGGKTIIFDKSGDTKTGTL